MHKTITESERKNFVVDIATDTFIAIFSFLTRRELGNSMELVCRRINLIIERNFQIYPKLVFRQFHARSSKMEDGKVFN